MKLELNVEATTRKHMRCFSDTAIDESKIKGYTGYHALRGTIETGKLPTEYNKLFTELHHTEAYQQGIVRQMGWMFDFRPLFKKYLVKWKYLGWKEHYAPNKTFIRRLASAPSHILKILEVDEF